MTDMEKDIIDMDQAEDAVSETVDQAAEVVNEAEEKAADATVKEAKEAAGDAAQAAPKAQMAGTASVPERYPLSWPPPVIKAGSLRSLFI